MICVRTSSRGAVLTRIRSLSIAIVLVVAACTGRQNVQCEEMAPATCQAAAPAKSILSPGIAGVRTDARAGSGVWSAARCDATGSFVR